MSDLDREMIPAPIAPFVSASASLRFHQVMDDLCVPEIHPRDYVLIALVTGWKGEGYYLFQNLLGMPVLYYCSPTGTRSDPHVRLGILNPLYRSSGETIPYDEFQERVLGKVAMTCKMKDSSLLPRI